jgi:hypothetical protein
VELHHVGLGLGDEPEDWPEELVALVLPEELAILPARIDDPSERAAVLAWIAGRRSSPGEVELGRSDERGFGGGRPLPSPAPLSEPPGR